MQLRLGRWDEGESVLNAAVVRATETNDRFHQAQALNNLGMGRFVRNRFDEALPWFERILSLTNLQQLTLYLRALYNAGMCYARLGQFNRAVALQHRAVELYQRRGASRDREHALGQLGITYELQGNAREGLAYLRQAFDVATASSLTDDAALWAGDLALVYTDIDEWKEAQRFNDEARRVRLARGTGRLVYNTLNDAHIAAGLGKLDEAEKLFLDTLADSKGAPDVVWEAEAGLANVAIAAKRPDRAARHFEAALDTIEKTRSDLLKSDYKLSFLTRLIQFYQAYVDALVDQGQTERALEIADSSRGRVLAERQGGPPPVRARAVASPAGEAVWNSVAVGNWLGPSRSYVWVVNEAGVHYRPLPPPRRSKPSCTSIKR